MVVARTVVLVADTQQRTRIATAPGRRGEPLDFAGIVDISNEEQPRLLSIFPYPSSARSDSAPRGLLAARTLVPARRVSYPA